MDIKRIKSINGNLKVTGDKVYLCIWNDGEIVEIHTLKTLLNDYFDISENWKEDNSLAYSGLTWKEIFKNLDAFCSYDNGTFESHLEDNMYIKRIK